MTEAATRTCYRHPGRHAGVVCQRCDRPICPECMHQASVGFHCPECVRRSGQRVVTARTLRNRPVVTLVLLAINVAVFLVGLAYGHQGNLFDSGNGDLLLKGGLVSGGLDNTGHLVGVAYGQWWRVITAGFLHFGLIHLALNMWALWILGRVTEAAAGRVRMAVIYAVALVAGSFGAMIVTPHALTAGASGAIYGLMGGLLVVARARGVALRDTGLLGILALNLAFTFGVSGISIGGHIGGLVGGALAAVLVVDLPERMPQLRGRSGDLYAVGVAVVLSLVLTVATVQVAKGDVSSRSVSAGPVPAAVTAPPPARRPRR